ncbi:MerR family transcriptional regulator [Streptomyces nanshensis]|uniref:MerR family transcriptional regulator n=1 Tax=Streptomyces nanshensis TaxID=518642 RepID=A0A1E7L9B8_9ACTN|nr:MerR family transcriptional regulator [Streptomyces nanshensis]OEV12832.1 MerR family transcriptional regulator [Streptomyces nanshensis]
MEYTIREVAQHFGIAVSALRYYDEAGLLRPAGRRGTVRVYGRDELRRLVLIRLLHSDGMMSLTDTAVTLSDPVTDDHVAARNVIEKSVEVMQHKIQQLQEAQRLLEHLLTCPRDNPVRNCPYLQEELERSIDAALAHGPGADPAPGPGSTPGD